jgi:glycosyltransferase involved in cell wall biosynthesis
MVSRLNTINPTLAVVVTTYNNPTGLELCLLSLQNQTYKNFEVFIADDGSGDETRNLILKLKKELNFPIYHIWHMDAGYRKAKINNNVFREIDAKKYPILVCLDHDVIVHYQFLEDHLNAHREVSFGPLLFMGRRVDLGSEVSKKITPSNIKQFTAGLNFELIRSAIKGETKNIFRSVRLDAPEWVTKILKRDRVYDLLGSNYSITTQVMKDVNGYNEDFKSYWGEDGDLFVRVRNTGTKCIGKIGYAVQWHLFHERLTETPEHIEMYRALINNHEYRWCEN